MNALSRAYLFLDKLSLQTLILKSNCSKISQITPLHPKIGKICASLFIFQLWIPILNHPKAKSCVWRAQSGLLPSVDINISFVSCFLGLITPQISSKWVIEKGYAWLSKFEGRIWSDKNGIWILREPVRKNFRKRKKILDYGWWCCNAILAWKGTVVCFRRFRGGSSSEIKARYFRFRKLKLRFSLTNNLLLREEIKLKNPQKGRVLPLSSLRATYCEKYPSSPERDEGLKNLDIAVQKAGFWLMVSLEADKGKSPMDPEFSELPSYTPQKGLNLFEKEKHVMKASILYDGANAASFSNPRVSKF